MHPTIHTDVHHTRRKSLHHICDDTGVLVWSGARFEDALNYLVENGFKSCRVIGITYAFTLQIAALPQ